jgi:hypothetical protein
MKVFSTDLSLRDTACDKARKVSGLGMLAKQGEDGDAKKSLKRSRHTPSLFVSRMGCGR